MTSAPDALADLLTAAVAAAFLDLKDAVAAHHAYLHGADDLEDSAPLPPEIEALVLPGTPASTWAEGRGDGVRGD